MTRFPLIPHRRFASPLPSPTQGRRGQLEAWRACSPRPLWERGGLEAMQAPQGRGEGLQARSAPVPLAARGRGEGASALGGVAWYNPGRAVANSRRPFCVTRGLMRRYRRWIFLALGFVISGVFVYLALRGLNLREVWLDLRGANYWWLVPGVLVYFVAVWARTWRWHYLLRPIKRIRLAELFPVVVIGYMGNNVYPFRAGEVIRAYVLERNEGVRISASLATIVVERIFDGLVMLI